jgi:hypothetical protein
VPAFAFDVAGWFTDNAEQVDHHLRRYFGGKPGDQFTGRWFDHFAAIADPNRFEVATRAARCLGGAAMALHASLSSPVVTPEMSRR